MQMQKKRRRKDVIKALLNGRFFLEFFYVINGPLPYLDFYLGISLWNGACQTLLWPCAMLLHHNFFVKRVILHMYHFSITNVYFGLHCHKFMSWIRCVLFGGLQEQDWEPVCFKNTWNILFHFNTAIQTQLQTKTLIIEWKMMQCHKTSQGPLLHL